MKNSLLIPFLLFVLFGCKKPANEINNIYSDCSQNIFQAMINDTLFQTNSISINTKYCGPGQDCPFTNIYASYGVKPTNYHFFSIHLFNSKPGTYYLGELGVKRDSINLYTGDALYDNQYSASNFIGYQTDSLYTGILTIVSKDETNRIIKGNFSFTAKRLMTEDTTLIYVTDGNFVGCY
jgi:hypothetical protein